ncbi:hypothetical protein HDF14_002824 [Edaphobacter lichenicola]|uniref:MacB-like periplasmic core domain-containing protein n=1 Tax=Tunturiibacter gelidiferens TaxID=3069689 RepID=A0A9X0QEZ2_9BACT|nr:ABC transporter permease [Edaphobacter lichenicola]MBB5329206.1 hypothetical protein [Edaphobacter lichenicola]
MDEFVAAEKAGQAQPTEVRANVIASHYFSAIGIPIFAGRDLENKDSDRNSCVISQAAARLYFPNSSALGKTLRNIVRYPKAPSYPFHDFQIVGIVQDTKYTLRESPPPIVYLPITIGNAGMTNAGANLFFIIRARNAAAARSAYLATLHEMAPSSPEITPFRIQADLSRFSLARAAVVRDVRLLRIPRSVVKRHWRLWSRNMERDPENDGDWSPNGTRRDPHGSLSPRHAPGDAPAGRRSSRRRTRRTLRCSSGS